MYELFYKFPPQAHESFGVRKFIKKLHQWRYGYTDIVLFKDSIKFSRKPHTSDFYYKGLYEFESLTIQCDPCHPFREHWSKFIKRTNRKPRSRYNKVWTILLFQEFYVSFHWKLLFTTLNILKSFSQVQCGLIHSVNLERFDQFLSKVRLVWYTLSFVTSGQETILKMREKKKNLSMCSFSWRDL